MADQPDVMTPYMLVPRYSTVNGHRLCVEGQLRQFDSAEFIQGLRHFHDLLKRSKDATLLLLDFRRLTDIDGPAANILMTAANIFHQMTPPCVIRIVNVPERFRGTFTGCTPDKSRLQIGAPAAEQDKGRWT